MNTQQFQLGQAVHARFWGDNVGRIVSATLMDWGVYYYEVERADGSIVVEPETHLRAAPELESVLPLSAPRATLTSREIEAHLDTPDNEPSIPTRDFYYANGNQLPKF